MQVEVAGSWHTTIFRLPYVAGKRLDMRWSLLLEDSRISEGCNWSAGFVLGFGLLVNLEYLKLPVKICMIFPF